MLGNHFHKRCCYISLVSQDYRRLLVAYFKSRLEQCGKCTLTGLCLPWNPSMIYTGVVIITCVCLNSDKIHMV